VPIDRDAWFVVEASGSANLFPVVAPQEYASLSPSTVITALSTGFDLSALDPFGNLSPAEVFPVTPLAITNPIWVDFDGNGAFDPSNLPGTGDPAPARGPAAPADVRDLFDRFAAEPRP
jgi:hypothetical protein